MTMLPGQPRRVVRPAAVPPLPPGWTRVTREAPPASWSGLPQPQRARPPTPWPAPAKPLRDLLDRTMPVPRVPVPRVPTTVPSVADHVGNITATVKAKPQGALARLLRGNAKVVAVIVGMVLTVLTMIDGLGFVPSDARDIVAIMFAALTPIAVALIPDYKPRKGGA